MPHHLTEAPIDTAALLAKVQSPGAGAVVLFLGNVRDSHAGRAVRGIHYSGYRSMAERSLLEIERALAREHGALVRIVHRLGDIAVGESSVAIATAAPHRAAAYAANRSALERLKSEVPVWKRELYADGGEAWREEESLVP
ncbi:MAG: molybdenum cofactor biosynthesis protein MoaE [Acidobacteriota bacterium]